MKALALATLALLLQEIPEHIGQQLIERLKDESTRSSAYYELVRRNGDKDSKNEDEFRNCHRAPELVVCPQEEGKPPIYVLLSDFLEQTKGPEGFSAKNDQMFKPPAPGSRKKMKGIDAFTANGKQISPFGGDNVVDDGLFADINRAGFVVKVDGDCYSHRKRESVSVLKVSVVREKAEPLFAVLYSFGAQGSWYYDFIDEDGDGIPEIQFGPRTLEDEVVPRVTFKWDPAKKTYIGPNGGDGDHFRVINPTNMWNEFERLETANVIFPPEEDRAGLRKPGKAPAEKKAYSYISLKGRSDEHLFEFMGRSAAGAGLGREGETVEPPGFWTLEPKAAALALVEANRSTKHRSQIQLALDDRDGTVPGETGTLRFTCHSPRCYVAHDVHFLLQCRPKASFLLVASAEGPGVVLREMGRKDHSQNIRYCSLGDQEARHLLQVIGWLNRIRSKSDGWDESNSIMYSTGDGRGVMKLTFTGPKAEAVIEADGKLWSDSIPDRWESLYSKETYLNFAQFLLERVKDRRLPEVDLLNWTEQEKACARLIDLHLADPSLMPTAMVKVAYDMAGDLGLSSVAPLLEQLKNLGRDGDAPAEALRKIGLAKDGPALEKMAHENDKQTDWALLQLKTRFPGIYPRVLEAIVEKSPDDAVGGRRLEYLAAIDVARARRVAAVIPPSAGGQLGRAAFAILRDAPVMDREAERVKAQLETVADSAEEEAERAAAIEELVPPLNPSRFPGPEIDAALEAILKERGKSDFTQLYAAKALERRSGSAHFDLALAVMLQTKQSLVAQEMLSVMTTMGQQASAEQRGRLAEYLRGNLKETSHMMSKICREIWTSDLREFKPDLERLATAGIESVESDRADSASEPAQPVRNKFHRARQIAQLWSEEDAVTRAKLLVAMALHEAYLYVKGSHSGPRRRFDQELAAVAKELSAEQKNEVAAFASAFAPRSVASGAASPATVVQKALK